MKKTLMDTYDVKPEIYKIKRRTARARALSWVGTGFFVLDLVVLYLLVPIILSHEVDFRNLLYFENPLDVEVFRKCIFAALFFFIAVILWTASFNAQQGTIAFYNEEKITCRCERAFIDILPGQVTSVQQDGDVVRIMYMNRTLTIQSENASQIKERVQDFISAYKYSGNNTVNNSIDPLISAAKIREYKELVDEGIITKEQFDAIVSKITKST
jgi:hypothetical protein